MKVAIASQNTFFPVPAQKDKKIIIGSVLYNFFGLLCMFNSAYVLK